MKHPLACAIALALAFGPAIAAQAQSQGAPVSAPATASNPFFADSTLPLKYPAFDKIKDADFAPAFDAGMQESLAEAEAVANNPEPPTFENTILPLEKGARTLYRAQTVFYN